MCISGEFMVLCNSVNLNCNYKNVITGISKKYWGMKGPIILFDNLSME